MPRRPQRRGGAGGHQATTTSSSSSMNNKKTSNASRLKNDGKHNHDTPNCLFLEDIARRLFLHPHSILQVAAAASAQSNSTKTQSQIAPTTTTAPPTSDNVLSPDEFILQFLLNQRIRQKERTSLQQQQQQQQSQQQSSSLSNGSSSSPIVETTTPEGEAAAANKRKRKKKKKKAGSAADATTEAAAAAATTTAENNAIKEEQAKTTEQQQQPQTKLTSKEMQQQTADTSTKDAERQREQQQQQSRRQQQQQQQNQQQQDQTKECNESTSPLLLRPESELLPQVEDFLSRLSGVVSTAITATTAACAPALNHHTSSSVSASSKATTTIANVKSKAPKATSAKSKDIAAATNGTSSTSQNSATLNRTDEFWRRVMLKSQQQGNAAILSQAHVKSAIEAIDCHQCRKQVREVFDVQTRLTLPTTSSAIAAAASSDNPFNSSNTSNRTATAVVSAFDYVAMEEGMSPLLQQRHPHYYNNRNNNGNHHTNNKNSQEQIQPPLPRMAFDLVVTSPTSAAASGTNNSSQSSTSAAAAAACCWHLRRVDGEPWTMQQIDLILYDYLLGRGLPQDDLLGLAHSLSWLILLGEEAEIAAVAATDFCASSAFSYSSSLQQQQQQQQRRSNNKNKNTKYSHQQNNKDKDNDEDDENENTDDEDDDSVKDDYDPLHYHYSYNYYGSTNHQTEHHQHGNENSNETLHAKDGVMESLCENVYRVVTKESQEISHELITLLDHEFARVGTTLMDTVQGSKLVSSSSSGNGGSAMGEVDMKTYPILKSCDEQVGIIMERCFRVIMRLTKSFIMSLNGTSPVSYASNSEHFQLRTTTVWIQNQQLHQLQQRVNQLWNVYLDGLQGCILQEMEYERNLFALAERTGALPAHFFSANVRRMYITLIHAKIEAVRHVADQLSDVLDSAVDSGILDYGHFQCPWDDENDGINDNGGRVNGQNNNDNNGNGSDVDGNQKTLHHQNLRSTKSTTRRFNNMDGGESTKIKFLNKVLLWESYQELMVKTSNMMANNMKRWDFHQKQHRHGNNNKKSDNDTPFSPMVWLPMDQACQDFFVTLRELMDTVPKGTIDQILKEHERRKNQLSRLLQTALTKMEDLLEKSTVSATSENHQKECAHLRAELDGARTQLLGHFGDSNSGGSPVVTDQIYKDNEESSDGDSLQSRMNSFRTKVKEGSSHLVFLWLKLGNFYRTKVDSHRGAPVARIPMGMLADQVRETRKTCHGLSGGNRAVCILVGLFYRWLTEVCDEWRAELAEQELLDNIASASAGDTGDLFSQHAIASGGKSKSKKSKKKKTAAAAAAATKSGSNADVDSHSISGNVTDKSKQQKSNTIVRQSSAVSETTDGEAPTDHHELKYLSVTAGDSAERVDGTNGVESRQPDTSDLGGELDVNQNEPTRLAADEILHLNASGDTGIVANELSHEISEDPLDNFVDISVGDRNSYVSAEDFLVGRLIAILNNEIIL